MDRRRFLGGFVGLSLIGTGVASDSQFRYESKVFLKTVQGFQTGLEISSSVNDTSVVNLKFFKTDLRDPSIPAKLVKEVEFFLGPQSSVTRVVRESDIPDINGVVNGWGVLESVDSVFISSTHPIKVMAIAFIPNRDGTYEFVRLSDE